MRRISDSISASLTSRRFCASASPNDIARMTMTRVARMRSFLARKSRSFKIGSEGTAGPIRRQMTVASLSLFLLAGCSGNPFSEEPEVPRGTIGYVSGLLGLVSVDEPQAALIGRDILSAGGSAGDAATAIGLALSVTMPSAASLGGGGLCIAREAGQAVPEVIEFLPRAPSSIPSGTVRPTAVPGNPRGLFLVHTRYGRLNWEQVIAPAERLARFGYTVSRAFATELTPVADALFQDSNAAQVFRRPDGKPFSEGDVIIQSELAATLARLRLRGAGEFYLGAGAEALSDAINSAGGSVSKEDLRAYTPRSLEPVSFNWVQSTTWHFAGPPAVGGVVGAEMLALLLDGVRFEKAPQALREHLLAEVAKRAYANRMRNLGPDGSFTADASRFVSDDYVDDTFDAIEDDEATPLSSLIPSPVDWPETPSAVSFIVIDITGGAVACTLTMNNAFGTGRMAEGHGFMLAAAPDTLGRTSTPVGPVLLTSEFYDRVYLAAAASGGVTAPTALVNVLARVAVGPQSLRESIAAPRTHYSGVPDRVFVESEMPADVVEALRRRAHDVALTRSIGRVAVGYCNTGIPNEDGVRCASATDPRGHGLSFGGN